MRNFVVLAAVAAAGGSPVAAQPLDAPQPSLTRAEARTRADRLFQMFDVNHDGIVTRAEAQQVGSKLMIERATTGRDVAPGIGGRTLAFLERRFADTDSVTKQQFEDAMLAHFDSMDRNHDGILTAAERQDGKSEQASR